MLSCLENVAQVLRIVKASAEIWYARNVEVMLPRLACAPRCNCLHLDAADRTMLSWRSMQYRKSTAFELQPLLQICCMVLAIFEYEHLRFLMAG